MPWLKHPVNYPKQLKQLEKLIKEDGVNPVSSVYEHSQLVFTKPEFLNASIQERQDAWNKLPAYDPLKLQSSYFSKKLQLTWTKSKTKHGTKKSRIFPCAIGLNEKLANQNAAKLAMLELIESNNFEREDPVMSWFEKRPEGGIESSPEKNELAGLQERAEKQNKHRHQKTKDDSHSEDSDKENKLPSVADQAVKKIEETKTKASPESISENLKELTVEEPKPKSSEILRKFLPTPYYQDLQKSNPILLTNLERMPDWAHIILKRENLDPKEHDFAFVFLSNSDINSIRPVAFVSKHKNFNPRYLKPADVEKDNSLNKNSYILREGWKEP